jgi:hypothetical protein
LISRLAPDWRSVKNCDHCGLGECGGFTLAGAFFTHFGRFAFGLGVGQPFGFGMGELGESTAVGEPCSAADCGSAMEVADGSGVTITVVRSLERLGMGLAAGSPGGGVATGLF